MEKNKFFKEKGKQQALIIQQLLSILKKAPTKEQALSQMSTFFEQDEALANTQASALLIHTLESRQVYPHSGSSHPPWSICRYLPPFVQRRGMVWPPVWSVIGSSSKNSRNKATSGQMRFFRLSARKTPRCLVKPKKLLSIVLSNQNGKFLDNHRD